MCREYICCYLRVATVRGLVECLGVCQEIADWDCSERFEVVKSSVEILASANEQLFISSIVSRAHRSLERGEKIGDGKFSSLWSKEG